MSTLGIEQIKRKMDPKVIAAIKKYFPANEVDMAISIAWEESNGNPNAVGDNKTSKDHGVFQINDYHHSEVNGIDKYDVDANVKLAAEIQSKRGWSEWNTKDKAMGNLSSSLFDAKNYIKTGVKDASAKYANFKTATYDKSMGSFNKGIKSDDSLKEFQRFLGVKDDGMYGPITDAAAKSFFSTLDNSVDTPIDETIKEISPISDESSLLDGLKVPGSFDLNTFNFGIKKEGAFGDFKLNGNKNTPTTNTSATTEEDPYLKSIKDNQRIGTALEVGKLATNVATYIRNDRTQPPAPLEAGSIPLLGKNFMNADYSQIDQDMVRMLGATREAGGNVANLSPLLRGATDAKLKLGATTNQFNLQENARVDTANVDIMTKNLATKLGVDQYNRETNLKLGASKGAAQTALMQGMFDNVTNIVSYRNKAATNKEEYRRSLADEKIKKDSAAYGSLFNG